jgi:F0F1-type ATP synthase beta subunit
MATATKISKGQIIQVVGVVVDVEFDGKLPAIYNALKVKSGDREVILEVAQHLSQDSVRAIALGTTDGLVRGDSVEDTGAPISVPIGKETLAECLM